MNKTDLARIDLNLLVLFEVMAQELHVTRTAARLHISPSAVSHGLTRLRRTLNDPLFIKQPRGMAPTDRALALVATVSATLDVIRKVVDDSIPFDPRTSHRQFRIGMADGFFCVVASLMAGMSEAAPFIDVSLRHMQRESSLEQLDNRHFDLTIGPSLEEPARFHVLPLYQERFVIAMRRRHPFGKDPSLDNYCRQRHLMVAPRGDFHGMADEFLARIGRERRVVLTAPSFLLALELLEGSDMLALLPESFVCAHQARYKIMTAEIPFPVDGVTVKAIAPQSAMNDAGMRWLFERLAALACMR